MEKGFWKSRTFWLNAVTLAVYLLAALLDHSLVASHPQWVAALSAVVATLNLVLRFLTTQPISLTAK